MMGILWLAGCVETGDESTVDLPTTTQPAAVNNAPAYHIALVDPLYESTAGAKAVAVGDINNDGVMDFASISSESQRVQIHLQDPLIGTFDTIAIAGGAPITRPTAIELADLNGDGKLDVIVLVADTGFASASDAYKVPGCLVFLFQGADPTDPSQWVQLPGAGSPPPENLTLPGGDGVKDGPTALLVGTFDERPGPDIVVTANGPNSSEVRLFSNPGGASAMTVTKWIGNKIESDLSGFGGAAMADLDADGDLDIALTVPEAKSFNLRWLVNPRISPAATTGSGIPTYTSDHLGALFETTARAKTVVVGDINNDGLADVASISDDSQPVQIHLRNPVTGEFRTISVASGPPLTSLADIELADLNRDGKLDIVLLVADTGLSAKGAQPALVMLIQGADPATPADWTMVPGLTGSFPTNLLLGNVKVSDIVVGQMDGENGPDILVVTKGAVRLFRNPGDAQVTSPALWLSTIIEANASEKAKVDLADIDNDGDQDVVMTDAGGSGFNVRWLQNPLISPPGTDLSRIPTYMSDLVRPDLIDPLFESTAGASAVALGDINNDGLVDAVSVSDESQTVQIHLMNAETGVFNPAINIAGGGPLARMNDVELVDLNADGKLDIVVLVEDSGFAPPSGVRKIGALVLLIQGANPEIASTWTQVDFLGDPREFLEDPDPNDADVIVPIHTFRFFNNNASLTDMVIGDFTGDGLPDIVVASNEDPQPPHTYIYLFPNPGAASVTDPSLWSRTIIESNAPDFGRLDVGDIDLDGDLDVVVSVPTAKTLNLHWLENRNNGTVWVQRVISQQQDGAEVLAVGDIDNDGDLDVVACSATARLTQWFRNPGPAALLSGAQVPWEVFTIGELGGVPGVIDQVRLVDLNGDGVLDAFVTLYDSQNALGSIYGFQAQTDLEDGWEAFQIDATGAHYGRVAFHDFDGNGRLDFLAPLNYPGLTDDRIAFYTAVIDARWRRNVVGQQNQGADLMSVGDIDGDGNPDVAVASVSLGLTQWFKNPGPAALAPDAVPVPWRVFNIGETSSDGLSQVRLVDLDGDGQLDVFLTVGGSVAAYRRTEVVEDYWQSFAIDATDATFGRVAFADIDNDGKLDFIAPLDRDGITKDRIVVYTAVASSNWYRRLVGQQPGALGIIDAADVDGDGHVDVASATGNLIQWFRNPGSSTTQSARQIPWDVFNIGFLTDAEPGQVRLADLDGNGEIECIVTGGGKAWGFDPQDNIEDYWTRFPLFTTDPPAVIGKIGIADFNRDGKLDFVAPVDRVDTLVKDHFVIFIRK